MSFFNAIMNVGSVATSIRVTVGTVTTRIAVTTVNGIGKVLSSPTTGAAVNRAGSNLQKTKAHQSFLVRAGIAVGGLTYSAVGWVIYLIAAFVLFLIIFSARLVLYPLTEGLYRAVKRIGKSKTKIGESDLFPLNWIFVLLNFVVLNIIKLFEIFTLRYIMFIIRNIVSLVALATVAFILWVVRTRVASLNETYAQTVILGTESYNAGSDVANTLLDIQNTMLPYTNTITTTSMLIVVHISDGINRASTASSDAPPDPIVVNGRLLQDTQASSLLIVETLAFIEITMNYLTLLIIDVYFAVIHPILGAVVTTLVFIITFLACTLASAVCALREFGVTILAEAIYPFGYALFGGAINFFGGPSLRTAQDNAYADLACSAVDLQGVDCVCGGRLLDPSSAGFFSNLEECDDPTAKNQTTTVGSRRALTVRCYQADDGSFIEEVDDMTLQRSFTDVCPSARRAFGAYTHAVDMQRWDVHTCITHCVNNTAFSACDNYGEHSVEVLGSCDGGTRVNMARARHNLAFLNVDTSKLKRAKSKPTRRARQTTQTATTRAERASALRSSTPNQFWIDGVGQCDLTSPATSLFEWMDDVMCVVMYHSKKAQTMLTKPTMGRNLQSRAAFDAAHLIRTSHHMINADVNEIENPHPLKVIWNHMRRPKSRRQRIRRRMQDVTAPDPDSAVKCMDRYWCPQTDKCVVDMKLCTTPPEEWTPLLFLSYHMGEISSTIETFDAERLIRDTLNCYSSLPDSQNPVSPTNLFRDMDAMTSEERLTYCPGTLQPSSWRAPRVVYDARKGVQTLCTGTPNFQGCKCPDYFGTSLVEYQYKGLFSLSLMRILADGFKWVLLTFVLIGNAFVGVFYQMYVSVTGTLRLPKWTRLSAYGLTHDEILKCWALHAADGLIFIIFCILGFGLLVCVFEYCDWFIKKWVPDSTAKDWMLLRSRKQLDEMAMKNPEERLMRRFKKTYDFYDFDSSNKIEFVMPFYEDDEAEVFDDFQQRVKQEYGYVAHPLEKAKAEFTNARFISRIS